MMAKVGYRRVSSRDQHLDRQLSGITLDKMFDEKCSAKTVNRPVWQTCLNYLREGDELHIHSLDRVCRSGAGDAVKIVESLTAQGITVEFHKEGMRFNDVMTATQKGVLAIIASIAQMERELIAERRDEGIVKAREKGKKFGRPRAEASAEEIIALREQGLSMDAIARRLAVGRATLYRIINSTTEVSHDQPCI